MSRTIPKAAIDIIKYAEAGQGINARSRDGRFLYRTCYLCPADVPTIGWGNTSSVKRSDVGRKTITESEAEVLLAYDIEVRLEALLRALQGISVNDNQLGALLSLVFNIGIGNFVKSTVLKKLKQGKYADVPAAMRLWNKGKVEGKLKVLEGLVLRRAQEGELFARPMEQLERTGLGSTPVHETPPAPETITKSRTMVLNAAAVTIAAPAVVHGVATGNTEQVAAFMGMLVAALATMGFRLDDFFRKNR